MGSGYTGVNARVAIVEAGAIRTDNNYLQGTILNRLNQCADDHTTKVAGVVGSDHPTNRGVAYSATLIGGESCDFSGAHLQLATLWSIIQQAQVLNNSWGADSEGNVTAMSSYQDDVVWTWRKTVIDAAGNHPCSETGTRWVLSPALAYNVIAVGNFSDNNTWSLPSGWNDDSMADSCYVDPRSAQGDRVKPDVAAPGVSIRTTSGAGNGLATASGSSLSAPHVAGVAALLTGANGSLRTLPEVVKAIIVASAIHEPLAGDAVDYREFFEKSGAGGVDAERALALMGQGTWASQRIEFSAFDASGCKNFYYYAQQNMKVRAAVAWTVATAYPGYANQPDTDLDLYVYRPDGAALGNSSTFDNTVELVEFTAPVSGNYRVCAKKARWAGEYGTYMGVAWLTPASSLCGPGC